MIDVIQLLPDAVANQIAAGEVVQRPASVVKELMENAIDAGATRVEVVLKNVGKGMIQVIDNGIGMSPRDARMAFERHATSKIKTAQDLFYIKTMGFRGEALASIASVAEVELKTKRAEDELGTYLFIADSELKKQENVSCKSGTNLSVKNLFYNIPARRKFLKSDTTELRNIVSEFLRVALTTPHVAFSLTNNGTDIYQFPISGIRQRIVNAFGKNMNTKLLSVACETSIVTISGFVAAPQHARKSYGEQFFFVNNRFMKHPFFHKAVLEAFSGLIGADVIPSYFLYLTVDPAIIDVNIHPTKTEIKFQDESAIFQILLASIKETLGKFNVVPTIDFDTEGKIDFSPTTHSVPQMPKVDYNANYNPFHHFPPITKDDSDFEASSVSHSLSMGKMEKRNQAPAHWESLFQGGKEREEEQQMRIAEMDVLHEETKKNISFLQMKGRYIIVPVHSGLMFIDQKRAHERVLYERYMKTLLQQKVHGQKNLFPETLEFTADDFLLVGELLENLSVLGFDLKASGQNSYTIHAIPPDLSPVLSKSLLLSFIDYFKNTEGSIREKAKERIALSLAQATSLNYSTSLDKFEMNDLFDHLFACQNPNYTADGKRVLHILKDDEVSEWFK